MQATTWLETIPGEPIMVGGAQPICETGSTEEEPETAKEIAEAVQETGKAVQGVAELAETVGKWMSRVMGTIPEDVAALVAGDRLRMLRLKMQLEHLESIRVKQEEILKRRGVKTSRPIGLKHAIPIFEAMADESDETLQDLWARLLANAMDPNRDIDLQQIFIDTLRQFEPIDALIFSKLSTSGNQLRSAGGVSEILDNRVHLSMVQLSLRRLDKLECIDTKRASPFSVTPLGAELWLVIGDDGHD